VGGKKKGLERREREKQKLSFCSEEEVILRQKNPKQQSGRRKKLHDSREENLP